MCEFTVRDIAEIIVGYAAVCAAAAASNHTSNLLLDGLPVYDFDTDTLNGWIGGARGAAVWDSANKVLGNGAMRIDVTNMLGNWADPVVKNAALGDAPWALNSNLVAWVRASGAVWADYLRPCLVMTVGGGATNLNYELYANGLPGHVVLDDAWHPYVYAYDPAWLSNALWLSLAYQVTTSGEPIGGYFYVDNMRLLPGIVPEPALALLACLSLLTLSLRKPISQGTHR